MVETDNSDLVHATGLAISLIGMLLEGREILPKGEFSRHMANLARVTADTDPAQGDILEQWATITARVGRPPAH
jgi:hypothetical protein